MRLTERDSTLLRDMALSHVLSRDQLIRLGYFGSVSRANARLLALRNERFIKRLETPFFGQGLYAPARLAGEAVGTRIAALLSGRPASPRFLRHALAVTELRILLTAAKPAAWRFEQQAQAAFAYAGREWEVRPDGLAIRGGKVLAVEADMGNVAPGKIAAKLKAYEAFAASGECRSAWGAQDFSILFVTTGKLRASRLARLAPANGQVPAAFETFDGLGVPVPGAWS